MKYIQGTSPEDAVSSLKRMQTYRPYEYSGLKYLRKYDDEWYCFYCTIPKPNSNPLYKLT